MANTQETQNGAASKAMSGYRIAVAILAVVLVGLSILYFNISSQQKADYEALSGERDQIQTNLSELIVKYDAVETSNEQMKANMEVERLRADSVITKLKKERALNISKIRQYEKEVKTLREVMSGYLQQIDSLNNLNQELLTQNVNIQKQLTEEQLRAEKAEELASKLDNQVRQGALLIAQGIEIAPLNKRGRQISRVKRATQLSVNFNLGANKLTAPGKKSIYACITSPDGYVLTTEELPSFMLDGKKTTYSAMRDVDYKNNNLPVSIFFTGKGFVAGTYKVDLYVDGASIGSTKLEMR